MEVRGPGSRAAPSSTVLCGALEGTYPIGLAATTDWLCRLAASVESPIRITLTASTPARRMPSTSTCPCARRLSTPEAYRMPRPTARPSSTETSAPARVASPRSEEHTSELQSRGHLVCRLLL